MFHKFDEDLINNISLDTIFFLWDNNIQFYDFYNNNYKEIVNNILVWFQFYKDKECTYLFNIDKYINQYEYIIDEIITNKINRSQHRVSEELKYKMIKNIKCSLSVSFRNNLFS